MKALVVVAHPDDHVLWMGGTILKLNQWEWHILSLCNSRGSQSLATFNKSCKELNAKKFIAKELRDYQPRELMEIEQPLKMQKEILAFADNEYDLIFTHSINPNCEYDFHANHAEVRDAINQLLEENLLKTKVLFNFCYKALGNGQPVVADLENADYKVELTNGEIQRKRNLKQSFFWAEGDLKNLALWNNDEPKIEAFNFKSICELEFPDVFIKCKK